MTSIELLKQDLDAELKLGTKMVVNWDMYIEIHKQEMKEMYLKGIENYDPTFKRKDDTLKDYHIVDTNEMVEVHPLEILRNKIKCEISELEPLSKYSAGYKQAFIDVENMIMDMLAQLPQQEISDEEINKEAKNHHNYYEWSAGAKWYREQLKNK
jgi:hypothetical protein